MKKFGVLLALSYFALVLRTSSGQDVAPAYSSDEETDTTVDWEAQATPATNSNGTVNNNCSSYNPANEFVPVDSTQPLFALDTDANGKSLYICKTPLGVGLAQEENGNWNCKVIFSNGSSINETDNISVLREPNSELGISLKWSCNKQSKRFGRRSGSWRQSSRFMNSSVEISEGVKVAKCKSHYWGRRHHSLNRRHRNTEGSQRGNSRQMWRRSEDWESQNATQVTFNVPSGARIGLIFNNIVTLPDNDRSTCSFYKTLVCSNNIFFGPSPRWQRVQAQA